MKFITTYVHNVYHQSVVLKLLGIFFHNRHISILFLKLPMSAVWNGPQNISSEMGGLNFLVLRLLKVLKRAFKINFQLSGESSSWKRELWLAKSHVFITVCMANIERFTPLYAIMNSVENLRNCFHGLIFCTAGYFIKKIVWKHSPYGPVFSLQYLALRNFDTENVFYFLSRNTYFDFSIKTMITFLFLQHWARFTIVKLNQWQRSRSIAEYQIIQLRLSLIKFCLFTGLWMDARPIPLKLQGP